MERTFGKDLEAALVFYVRRGTLPTILDDSTVADIFFAVIARTSYHAVRFWRAL